MRARRLTPDSTRDTEWQKAEYARIMGEEAALRQEMAARLERDDCTCHRITVKSRGTFRTIHEASCTKWKPWMDAEDLQYAANVQRQRRGR
jgi:hypothetical protein